MTGSRDDILHPGASGGDAEFPSAPDGWTPATAQIAARELDLELGEDHWQVIRALQDYYARHPDSINVRKLLDALEEKFHIKGGVKYLYQLLPGGPVAQGCKLAGLQAPSGSVDRGFGSVQ
jgi:tRNA 2-thiouridine synthesizing protein E